MRSSIFKIMVAVAVIALSSLEASAIPMGPIPFPDGGKGRAIPMGPIPFPDGGKGHAIPMGPIPFPDGGKGR